MNDFAGKVVLLEAMAVWCPNCLFQQNEVRKLHELLNNPDVLVSITLDVDRNEEGDLLAEYADEWGFDGYFAVSTLEVNRALGNLYSAQYLNPPLSPMLLIDREGNTYSLPYGKKDAETLREFVEPYLRQGQAE
jgi:hypothetical protein